MVARVRAGAGFARRAARAREPVDVRRVRRRDDDGVGVSGARSPKRPTARILLDVNNVYVSAYNHGFDPATYLAAVPFDRVVQLHVAGHTNHGTHIIDSHIGPVHRPVWRLLGEAHRRADGASVLLEWDAEIPSFEEVHAEALRAARFIGAAE